MGITNIIIYVIMILSAFISFWQHKKGLKQFCSLKGWAFILVVILALLLMKLNQSEIIQKNEKIIYLQELAKIPTRNDLETILKKDRQEHYHAILEKLPSFYESLHKRFIEIPIEKRTPSDIAETLTDFFLAKGSDNVEPIFFKDKMSPKPNVSLFDWVEKYEDEIVDKTLDAKKNNTRIGRFVYDFIHENVLAYLSFQDPGNDPNHKDYNEPTISDMKIEFIKTALEKMYTEKLPNEFDFNMLGVYEKERKEIIELIK